MVKLLGFLLIPLIVFAGDFKSEVNRNPTTLGEGFTLTLTLTNSTPRSHPSLEVLNASFVIHSQKQSNSFYMENGKTTSSTLWQLTLIPQKSGKVIIPPISIETNSGTLFSDPIALQVSEESHQEQEVSLVTTTSTLKPYKNETFLYTVRLVSAHNLNNISLESLSIEDAIIEQAEKPKITKEQIHGVSSYVVEFNYLITPLNPGTFIIPALAVQGEIPERTKRASRDLFSMIQGFDRVKPFVLNTDRIQMKVASPEEGVSPWLPAESIVIKEIFDPAPLQAYEPITRNFEIYGEGVLATQLPDLSLLQGDKGLKVYPDKPELKNEFKNGKIHSTRKESYTLIPQKDGELTLPGISIDWWDVKNKMKKQALITSRTVQVLPPAKAASIPVEQAAAALVPIETKSPLLYAIIGCLATLLVIALIGLFVMQRKLTHLKTPPIKKAPPPQPVLFKPKPPKEKKEKKEKLPDLNPT